MLKKTEYYQIVTPNRIVEIKEAYSLKEGF